MEYGKIISRSLNLVWENKYLILLGFLASLGSGSGGGGSSFSSNSGSDTSGLPRLDRDNFPDFGQGGRFPEVGDEFAGMAIGVIITLICVFLVVALILWAVSVIARGGLIASVDSIESGGKSSFSKAWGAGWQRVGSLLGIGLIPAIPGLIILGIGILVFGALGGISALSGPGVIPDEGFAGAGIIIVLLACVIVPVALALSILRTFAERACMLEDMGVLDSYRRGWQVLRNNLTEAILLFLLQLAIGIVLGIGLFLPGLIAALCCFLWPLLLVFQGAVTAFVSSMWTLAWHSWAGGPKLIEKEPIPF